MQNKIKKNNQENFSKWKNISMLYKSPKLYIQLKKLKGYFIIVNMILSVFAFAGLIAAQGCSGGSCPKPTPTTPTTPVATTPIPGSGGSTVTPTPRIIPIGVSSTSGAPPQVGTGIVSTDTGQGGNIGGGGNTGGGGGGSGIGSGWGFGNINFQSMITKGTVGAGIFGTIGALAGGDNGALWGSVAGAIGGVVAALTEKKLGETKSTLLGLGVATIIFLATYSKKSQGTAEFYCLPWEAPIGGENCQKCNELKECSLYTCKSLGQACDIINAGTPDQKCVNKNPNDVNSPIIKMTSVTKEHTITPNNAVRPPATGVTIKYDKSNDGCLQAYTPLEFSFTTLDTSTGIGEPSQCKIDYNISNSSKTAFDEMSYYVGGDSLYAYNHTEKLSLPGPDAINSVSPVLQNDGEYNLFIRCRDANGNFNQDPFSVHFCVQKGPDTTPPAIVGSNIESGKPIQFNQSKLALEVYINEPSECKWSRSDVQYEFMENNLSCDNNVWEMNNNMVYTCRTTLTGLENRKENHYYFRCKDKPWANEGDRNVNRQSYHYLVIGTQPLNIMKISPSSNEVISGSTDTIPVNLEIETDNGYKNGDALCYYSNGRPTKEENYILFMNTSSSSHSQRQDLVTGNYTYYFKCVDLGGNTVYNSTSFRVDSDRREPKVIRVFREIGDLKIITDEKAKCSYSLTNCNFEIDSGLEMTSFNEEIHTAEWKLNQNYYIRCKDKYENQPNPNTCSIILKPSKLEPKQEVIEF